jgi:hypothetical protein
MKKKKSLIIHDTNLLCFIAKITNENHDERTKKKSF